MCANAAPWIGSHRPSPPRLPPTCMPAALCMEPSDRLQHAPLFGADHRVVGKALCAGMTATATEAGGIACHRPLGLARHTRPTPSDTGAQKATRSRRPLAHDQAQPLGFWVAAVAGPVVHGLWSARFHRRSCASPQRLARCARVVADTPMQSPATHGGNRNAQSIPTFTPRFVPALRPSAPALPRARPGAGAGRRTGGAIGLRG